MQADLMSSLRSVAGHVSMLRLLHILQIRKTAQTAG